MKQPKKILVNLAKKIIQIIRLKKKIKL